MVCVVVAYVLARPAATARWLAIGQAPPPGTAVARMLDNLKLMNYYPEDAAWTFMWSKWDPARLTRDFTAIRNMHANAVRIFVSPAAFGWPVPSTRMLTELHATVNLAAAAHLQVVLTIFDLWSDYDDLAASNAWATKVLQPYSNDKELAFVETRNEVNVNDGGEQRWLREQIPFEKKLLGTVPVTASVAGSVSALAGADAKLASAGIDFLDWHYLSDGTPTQVYDRLAEAKAIAGKLPLFLGEAGISTLPSSSVSESEADDKQLQFYVDVDWATASLGLPAAAPWTFTDFSQTAIPANIRSSQFPAEYFYGLMNVSGQLKPAGLMTEAFFASGRAPSVINGNFTDSSGIGVADWHVSHASEATFSWPRGISAAGGSSVEISRSTGDTEGLPSYDVVLPLAPTRARHQYTVTASVRGDRASGVTTVSLAWFDSSGRWLATTSSPRLRNGTTAWTPLTAAGPSPPGATKVMVYLQSAYNSGAAFFSNVTFAIR